MEPRYAAPAWRDPYRPRWGLAQSLPRASAARRTLVSLGIVGAGVAIGLVAWPHIKKPLGAIGLGAAGSMVAAGLIFLLLDAIGAPSPAEPAA